MSLADVPIDLSRSPLLVKPGKCTAFKKYRTQSIVAAMNKEPLVFYMFRFVMGLGLLIFLLMVHGSWVLVEKQLKELRQDVSGLRDHLKTRTFATKTTRGQTTELALVEGKHIDASLPNLLSTDPFYEKTLPELLGAEFRPYGTRRTASVGKPHNLHPFSIFFQVATWTGMCNVRAAQMHFGKYETLAPDMAIKMEERTNPETGHMEYWVHLRNGVFWQPLDPRFFSADVKLAPRFLERYQVTAHDFKFHFDVIMSPWVQEPSALAMRTFYGDIEEFRVVDDLTFVVRWKVDEKTKKVKYTSRGLTGSLSPLASWVYQYFADGTKIVEDDSHPDTYRNDSVFGQNFHSHWAKNIIPSCGAWSFDGFTERQIKFKRNADHYQPLAVLVDAMEVDFKDSPKAVWQAFKDGQLDSYGLTPDELIELEQYLQTPIYAGQKTKGKAIKRIDYIGRSYSWIGWNAAQPYFASKNVRQALTMAIDRQRIIDQNLNGMGVPIHGTFYPYSKATDPAIQPWPFDPAAARSMLEAEGWFDRKGEGTISKEGKPFKFNLTYYVKNTTTKFIAEYVSLALKDVGITCNLNGVDIADLSSMMDDKEFDGLIMGWSQGTPPEDPRQLWYSSGAKEKGSSNMVGFANAEADKIIEQLDYEYNAEKRIALYHRFDQIMHQEQPYTFLYAPKAVFLYRESLQNVFIPRDRQDLIPGADVSEPQGSVIWIKES